MYDTFLDDIYPEVREFASSFILASLLLGLKVRPVIFQRQFLFIPRDF